MILIVLSPSELLTGKLQVQMLYGEENGNAKQVNEIRDNTINTKGCYNDK